MSRSARDAALTNFYPRPPRGGRPPTENAPRKTGNISIHALREEGDRWRTELAQNLRISIHALREEGDSITPTRPQPQPYFYPRPPRGGRQETAVALTTTRKFLSTPSARRATRPECGRGREADHFYPRPPRGGRRAAGSKGGHGHCISIHALREEGDLAV